MADVFLSYSSKDRSMARRVERALTAAGYDVFWDQDVPVGTDWNSWIGGKLRDARVAIVLWSKTSVTSDNVIHEATIARGVNKLIPVVIEDLEPNDFPMGFYTLQGADLRGFGGGNHAGAKKLLAAVKERIDANPQNSENAPTTQRSNLESLQKKRWLLGVIVAFGALAAATLMFFAYVRLVPAPSAQAVVSPPPPIVPPKVDARALAGNWRSEGLACGEGPHIALSGEALIMSMAGAPPHTHAITSVEQVAGGLIVQTIIAEPEEMRGQTYTITLQGGYLTVKNDLKADHWEKCP